MDLLIPSQAIGAANQSGTTTSVSVPRSNNAQVPSTDARTAPVVSSNGPSISRDETKVSSTGRKKNRRRKKNQNNNPDRNDSSEPAGISSNDMIQNSGDVTETRAGNQVNKQHRKNRNARRKTEEQSQNKVTEQKSVNSKQRRNRNKRNKDNWWNKHIPLDAVDPITLDPLKSLRYPPFALVASEPYVPVEEWPVKESTEQESLRSVGDGETEEERHRRVLEEQWGSDFSQNIVKGRKRSDSDDSQGAQNQKPPASKDTTTNHEVYSNQQRHVNLFDGQALAYYMVSQLQFIDPLNRRDLTRDELVNLDRYLRRHGFGDKLNVTEAYDAKGITISTAGATANTASGRAAILQQEARNLLNALFRGTSFNTLPARPTGQRRNNDNNNSRSLIQQYRAHEMAAQQRQQQRLGQDYESKEDEDTGVYGEEGLIVIDDDVNPGLRGDAAVFLPTATGNRSAVISSTLWSASHVSSRYQQPSRVVDDHFPSLAAAVSVTPARVSDDDQEEKPKKKLPVAKTLSKIGSAVKKTDPEEVNRQWEARELARKKAMLSNLTLGSNQAAWSLDQQTGLLQQTPSSTENETTAPTDGQIERNKAFADALGIRPATVRSTLTSGWSRPTDLKAELDDFGNELNMTIYPDELILKARDQMALLAKLETKWINFLESDSAASLPLNKMDRMQRAIVHEYATFWMLHTESFDPEPRRYVHCVKLRDTRAPYPLLSDAARKWKGPRPIIVSIQSIPVEKRSEHSIVQTAGQSTRGREISSLPERTPLSLKPRSAVDLTEGFLESRAGCAVTSAPSSYGVSIGGAPSRTMTEPMIHPSESRFGILAAGRDRPKLDLKPRTLPLELPPQTTSFDVAEELRCQRERSRAKLQKEREKADQRQRALEAVFASDDESSVGKNVTGSGSNYDSDDSEWEEKEAIYQESDED